MTMRKILYLLATAMIAAAIASCTDNFDREFHAEVVLPDGTSLMQLGHYSYELPFEIQSNAEWVIAFDFDEGQICYAIPDHGTGSQTIKLCVLDNPGNTRRTGTMYVEFPQYENKTKVIDLQQNCEDDDMLGAADLPLGNRAYVVGYGYNVLAERASMNSVSMSPIIEIAKANDAGRMAVGPIAASFVAQTYSGSSVSELSNELAADASFGGKYLGFKGEVGASFGMKDFSKQENEYAISYVEADMQSVNMEMSISEIINKYMTDDAYNDINGLPTTGRHHVTPTVYPSTPEGLSKLVQTYGTHLVMSARLGGCMKYVMTVDISEVEGSYDLKAYANCAYSNTFVKASMSVSDEYKQSYANNSKSIQTVVKVQGGSSETAVNLAAANGDNDQNFSAWIQSLEDVKNQTLVGLDNTNLIPLYELVDQSLTLKDDGVDGKARYQALKEYIEGDQIEEDLSKVLNMDYEMGDATHLATIPDFTEESNSQDESLIMDYYRGGQPVARICSEYIPVIDKKERVLVIYPIVSNKVKYNMGYFAGDATHRPAKLCWSRDGLSVVSLKDQPMGAIHELYVRGSSFLDASHEEVVHALETVDATLQTYTVRAPGRDGAHDYPVVKIFNQLWMRDNYQANHSTSNSQLKCLYDGDGTDPWTKNDAFYAYEDEAQLVDFAPKEWRVSSADDFRIIQNTLNKNDVTHISTAKAFFPDADGGVLGFYARFTGAMLYGSPVYKTEYAYYGCLKNDGNRSYDIVFVIGSNEGFDMTFGIGWDDKTRFPVRLVHDIY